MFYFKSQGEDVHLANEIMAKYDVNQDGVIDYDEFVQTITVRRRRIQGKN